MLESLKQKLKPRIRQTTTVPLTMNLNRFMKRYTCPDDHAMARQIHERTKGMLVKIFLPPIPVSGLDSACGCDEAWELCPGELTRLLTTAGYPELVDTRMVAAVCRHEVDVD
jgi:hypothetical protein